MSFYFSRMVQPWRMQRAISLWKQTRSQQQAPTSRANLLIVFRIPSVKLLDLTTTPNLSDLTLTISGVQSKELIPELLKIFLDQKQLITRKKMLGNCSPGVVWVPIMTKTQEELREDKLEGRWGNEREIKPTWNEKRSNRSWERTCRWNLGKWSNIYL